MPKSFRYLEPTFFAGLFDDPLLLVQIRPLGRALLFDCGQLHHLAKRVLKSLDGIFVSHAHMDHFMGMDAYLRHSHVSPRTTAIFGPPGIARKMEAKFAAYDWNLAESFWGDLRVGEVHPDHRVVCTLYKGGEAFAGYPDGEFRGEIYRNPFLRVEAEALEHHIPVLGYRITERESFTLDEGRMQGAEIAKGGWLKELERLFHQNALAGSPIAYRGIDGATRHAADALLLYREIRRSQEPASIGYLTDIGFSAENLVRAERLLKGVTLLIGECAFLACDRDKARNSRHLCTADFNLLLDRLRPRFVIPMHLSKGYLGQSARLYQELEPPPGVTVLKIPDRITPRPLMACELPHPEPL